MHHDIINPTVVTVLVGIVDWKVSCSTATETAVGSKISRAVDTESTDGVDAIVESGFSMVKQCQCDE